MKIMTTGYVKSNFLQVIESVQQGEKIVIKYGGKMKKIAVPVPYDACAHNPLRIIGLLAGKASLTIPADFKINDDELLSL